MNTAARYAHKKNVSMSSGKAKEPAVVSAEKFMEAWKEGSLGDVSQTLLDPGIKFNCPMGIFHSRPYVKRWAAFELSVIQKVGCPVIVHGTVMDGDGMRVAKNHWSVAGLHFTDTITLNGVLMIKHVKRVMERRSVNAAEEKKTEELLLGWTGPYFSKYCGPKKGIDNRALILPVLDFSYQDISRCAELRSRKPKDAKEIEDSRIAYHFMSDATVEEIEAGEPTQLAASQLHHNKPKDEVVIKAKNREGEQAAIVVDRNALGAGEGEGGKIENLEDQEIVTSEEELRFVASGIKVNNNRLQHANDLEINIKRLVVNAFYFLNWVDLSSNLLQSIPDLSQLPIVVLYLHDNKIKDFQEVTKLQGLSNLQSLTLFGNPIQSDSPKARDYKYHALMLLWEGFKARRQGTKKPAKSPADMALRSFDHSVLTADDRQCIERFTVIHKSKSRPSSRAR